MLAPEQRDHEFFQSRWGQLEQIVERFEDAWQRGERPTIDQYLEGEAGAGRELVLELAHAELECRLKSGEPVRVESYFERYVELAGDRAAALRLIEAEYRLRQRSEPGLALEEYVRRFPGYREELAQRLRGPHLRNRWLPPQWNCPHCHKSVAAGACAAGDEITCGACGGSFRLEV